MPVPPADRHLVLIGHNGDPVPVNSKLTFKCADGMKYETDVALDTFEATCATSNTFEPADFAQWPKCKPSKTYEDYMPGQMNRVQLLVTLASTCNGLPSPGGNASIIRPATSYGPCLTDSTAAPSCADVSVVGYTIDKKVGLMGSARQRTFELSTNYAAADIKDLNLLVTFSYIMGLGEVRLSINFLNIKI